ncbi:MAG: contractile injection system protein, VgrG/Pvc8 family [Nostocoides sp.]
MTLTTSYVSTPSLTLNGTRDARAMQNVLSLTVEESIAGMSWCEATFNNWGTTNRIPGYLFLDRSTLDLGTRLSVQIGPDGGGERGRDVFAGRISALRADYPAGAPATVMVSAEDNLQDFRITRRTRTFDDCSTGDLVRTLAGDHGLTAKVGVSGPKRKVTTQLNQSDLAFLRAVARSDGGEVWLEGQTLHVEPRVNREQGGVSLSYGENLLSFSVQADLAHQCTDVAVAGWSVADKQAIREEAGSSTITGELGPGQTSGSTVLGQALITRHETLVRTQSPASDDARSLARAAYLERARRFVCGTGTAVGTPLLRVGTQVALSGLSGLFNGDYRVTRTSHHFDVAQGYLTDFDVQRAGIGAAR